MHGINMIPKLEKYLVIGMRALLLFANSFMTVYLSRGNSWISLLFIISTIIGGALPFFLEF
jgi:hypothetical protein